MYTCENTHVICMCQRVHLSCSVVVGGVFFSFRLFNSPDKPIPTGLPQERAHRIGQTQRVTIYRLICKETVEDIILKRALMKIRLTHPQAGAEAGWWAAGSPTWCTGPPLYLWC